jgi:hypothetical protein
MWVRHAVEDTVHDTYQGWRNERHSDADIQALQGHIRTEITNLLGNDTYFRSNNEESYINELEGNEMLDSVKGTVTYEDILNDAFDADAVNMDSIVISSDGFDMHTATFEQKTKIASFILNYLFTTDSGFSPYFTFDAAPAQIGKIFSEHATARGLIIPQNISDSATTSFMQLGDEPNLYAFPLTSGSQFVSRWNTFSPDYTVAYENTGFSEENPYGFTYNLINNNGSSIPYEFAPGQQQGPSLDYLLSLTLAAKSNRPLTKVKLPSNCLNLGAKIAPFEADLQARIQRGEESPFLDMKRAGDGDQADGARLMDNSLQYVVLVTGDRLLSVNMRLMKQRCILQYHQTLTIFRGKIPNIDPARTAAHEAARRDRYIKKYTETYLVFTDPRLLVAIDQFIASIPNPISGRVGLVSEVKRLLDHKIGTMIVFLQAFRNAIANASLPNTQPNEDLINRMIAVFNSGLISKSDMRLFLEIFNGQFNYKKDIPLLKYSFKPFKSLSSAIVALWAKLTSTHPPRVPINYFTLADSEGGYNKSLREIVDSIVPPISVPPPILLDTQTTKEEVGPIIQTFNPTVMSGGRRVKRHQRGGVFDEGRARARALVFKEICSVAATYIRTTLSPHIKETVKLSVLQTLRYSALRGNAAATQINLATAKGYFPEINEANLESIIAAQTPRAQAESANIFNIFLNQEVAAKATATLEEIQYQWIKQILEIDGADNEVYDTTKDGQNQGSVWWQILNPFGEDGQINGYHIFNSFTLQRDPLRTKYHPIFIQVPEIPSLLTLAVINDILEGAVGRQTSIFTQLFVVNNALPAYLKKLRIQTPDEWDNLHRMIVTIYRSISTGHISPAIWKMFGGSRRNTRRMIAKRSATRKSRR